MSGAASMSPSWLGRSVTELWNGLVVQSRVVHALALRETRTRFGEHKLGYIWALVEPLTMILTFWGVTVMIDGGAPGPLDMMPFLTTGLMTYDMALKNADRGALAISGNKALLFYPQVQPLDLVIARTALEVATDIVVLVILLGGHALVVRHLEMSDFLRMAEGLLLAAGLGSTLGLVFCSTSVVFPTFDRIRGPLMRPLFWISGIFFSANALPSDLRELALWNPIMHCIEIVRDGWFRSYDASHASPTYVLWWILGLAFLGLTLERAVRSKLEVA